MTTSCLCEYGSTASGEISPAANVLLLLHSTTNSFFGDSFHLVRSILSCMPASICFGTLRMTRRGFNVTTVYLIIYSSWSDTSNHLSRTTTSAKPALYAITLVTSHRLGDRLNAAIITAVITSLIVSPEMFCARRTRPRLNKSLAPGRIALCHRWTRTRIQQIMLLS